MLVKDVPGRFQGGSRAVPGRFQGGSRASIAFVWFFFLIIGVFLLGNE